MIFSHKIPAIYPIKYGENDRVSSEKHTSSFHHHHHHPIIQIEMLWFPAPTRRFKSNSIGNHTKLILNIKSLKKNCLHNHNRIITPCKYV